MNRFYVCLPVHNGGVYLEKCVLSILNQDYKNFRLLIFENCSVDGSLLFLSKINDERISLFRSHELLNINDNWDRINSYFKFNLFEQNDFATLIGHDDYYKETYLSTINDLINLNSEGSIFNTHFDLVNKFDKLVRPCKPIPRQISHEDFFRLRCWNHLDVYGTGYVFRVSDFLKVDGINVKFPLLLFSDDLLFFKLARLSSMVTSNSNEYCYRLHSSTSNSNSFSKVSNFLSALDMYLKEVENLDILNFNKDNVGYLKFSLQYLIFRHINLYNSFLYYFLYKEKIFSQYNLIVSRYLTYDEQKYFIRFSYSNNFIYFTKIFICFLKNAFKF